MNKEQYWKNFNLGIELQLSGNFIHDGLYLFDQLEHFYYEEDIFEFLYLISVGIERLLKIGIILIEHSENTNQEELEKSLITHNHLELITRIKKNRHLNLSVPHNDFLQLLSRFYKSFRYDRFNIKSFYESDKEKKALIKYLEKHLNIKIEVNDIFVSPNQLRYKKFIGRTIGKITEQLYTLISSEANRLNIYTYEIRSLSKSYKIFMEKDYTFEKERLLQKEILLYLLKNEYLETGFKKLVDTIEPLEFMNGSENTYSKCLFHPMKCREFIEEMEELYETVDDKKNRSELMNVFGSDIELEEDIDEEFYEDND